MKTLFSLWPEQKGRSTSESTAVFQLVECSLVSYPNGHAYMESLDFASYKHPGPKLKRLCLVSLPSLGPGHQRKVIYSHATPLGTSAARLTRVRGDLVAEADLAAQTPFAWLQVASFVRASTKM
jgi:hypothetical protein